VGGGSECCAEDIWTDSFEGELEGKSGVVAAQVNRWLGALVFAGGVKGPGCRDAFTLRHDEALISMKSRMEYVSLETWDNYYGGPWLF
jgi:hypothetical protein